MRGNLLRRPSSSRRGGSIPACAGEPAGVAPTFSPLKVYPRVCGGTQGSSPYKSGGLGLSPRVRGNPDDIDGLAEYIRSIPACAGEPSCRVRRRGMCWVYPRVCGGTQVNPDHARIMEGLSPRVRGNPALAMRFCALCGSIPACAGEPRLGWSTECRLRVYPRVCGGTDISELHRTARYGLSPRVRGNRRATAQAVYLYRSIPACAGEPIASGSTRVGRGVYPRVCGGTVYTLVARTNRRGLSPRVRGNP